MVKRIFVWVSMLFALAGCQTNLPNLSLQVPAGTGQGNTVAVSAAGFLEADDVTIAAEVQAQIVSMSADQGDAVREGQVLVKLDDTLAQAQRAQAAAGVESAQAALTQTLAGPRANAVASAKADLRRAQQDYLGALQAVTDTAALVANPPGLQVQVAQAEAQVKLAEQAIEQAKSTRAQAEALRDMNPAGTSGRDLQQQKLDAAQANLDAAKAQYDGAVAALEQLSRMRKFPAELVANWHAAQQQATVSMARVAVMDAALALANAGATAEQIAISQASVQVARAGLARVDEALTHYQVSSPMSGVVTSKLAQVGEVARAGTPLLVVSDLSQLRLVVYVPVTQMAQVAVGAPARVTVNAYPGETFKGVVSKIGSKAEFTPSNVQTKDDRSKLVFAITVSVPNAELRLKAGMPADVSF